MKRSLLIFTVIVGMTLIIINLTLTVRNVTQSSNLQISSLIASAGDEAPGQWNPTHYQGETDCCCNGNNCWECSVTVYQYCWFPGTSDCTQGTWVDSWEDCETCMCN